jgi:hypothetical protein
MNFQLHFIRLSVVLMMVLGLNVGYAQRQNNQVLTVDRLKPSDLKWKKPEQFLAKTPWLPLDQNWIGAYPTAKDFKGSFKLGYTEDSLYIMARIEDDTLIDIHSDPLVKYWDDDCLEIFIDADASGGPHQSSYNAWAYHIALDNKVVDYGPDGKPHFYPHAFTKRVSGPKGEQFWFVAVAIHSDQYKDQLPSTDSANKPIRLKKGQKLGFALAYCDNDRSTERENFMGSVPVPGEDKNQGFKNAWVFGLIKLK